MTTAVKSFRRAVKHDVNLIQGTKPSPQNFSLLTSCGLQALDTILGGGLPIGSLILIEEDQYGIYSEVLAKYFISEGILCNHKIFVAGLDTNFDDMFKSLPGPAEDVLVQDKKETSSKDDEMTIAWRYKNMKIADTTIDGKNSFGHKLQLNVPLKPSDISMSDIIRWPMQGEGSYKENLLDEVIKTLKDEDNQAKPRNGQQVVRVAVLGLGSPSWDQGDVGFILYNLRSWLRRSVAVGLVTIPSHLYQDKTVISKWIHFSDMCIKLESFAGTARATNPALKDYHGLFHVIKLPAFNSLAPHIPDSDLAFKLRRRKLVIQRLSLPPELEDTTARGDSSGLPVTGCGTPRSHNLEF